MTIVRWGLRGLVGLVGMMGVVIASQLWFRPEAVAAKMGLIGVGPLGQATLRADVGGFFGAVGLFALTAAVRDDGRYLTPPLVMVGLAISGRLFAAVVNGVDPNAVQSIVIEAVMLVIFGLGRAGLGTARGRQGGQA